MASINIGGAEREVKYSFEAMRRIEIELNTPTGEILNSVTCGSDVNKMIAVIWGGLLFRTKNLTIEMVSMWLDKEEDSFVDISLACVKEYAESATKKFSFGKVSKDDEEDNSKN